MSEREASMAFYEGFYNVTLLLPEDERDRARSAMLELYFEGVEPEGLSASQALAFSAVEGRIRKARAMSSALKSGGKSVPKSVGKSGLKSEPTSVPKSVPRRVLKSGHKYPLKSRQSESESKSIKEKDPKGSKEKAARFTRPTMDDLRAYARDHVDGDGRPAPLPMDDRELQRFLDYYESNGWKVGKNPMRSWRAALSGWASRNAAPAPRAQEGGVAGDGYSTL